MIFHGCPRCKVGDIKIEKDIYGEYICCLQCGYNEDIKVKTNRKYVGLK